MLRYVICLGSALILFSGGCSDSFPGLSSSDAGERARALQRLAAAGDEKAVEQVAALVKHGDTRTASQAIEALGRMSSARACDALRDVMTSERRPELRKWAAVSLAQRREPQAAETLRRAVGSDPAPEVRAEAALGLARVGNIDDVDVLANAAGAENDAHVAHCEVSALEALIGVRFPYDPNASPEARKAELERIRSTARNLAQTRKGRLPAELKCQDTRAMK
jgi:HEAT repeat protein